LAIDIHLRDVLDSDIPIFCEHQTDAEAIQMVGLPARSREALVAHWQRALQDPTNVNLTIVVDGVVAGNVVCYGAAGNREVGYWIGRDFWGRGIATTALRLFLMHIDTRPLYAHVARHNIASRRVLEKCGFVLESEDSDEQWLVLQS
jgi:RimJ/RimL family protein N-acetyltransferase